MKNGHSNIVIPLITPHWASAVAENENGRIPRHHLSMVDGERAVLLFWQESFTRARIFDPIPYTAIRAAGKNDLESVLNLYKELGWDPIFTAIDKQKHGNVPTAVRWCEQNPSASLEQVIDTLSPENQEALREGMTFFFEKDPMTRYVESIWKPRLIAAQQACAQAMP